MYRVLWRYFDLEKESVKTKGIALEFKQLEKPKDKDTSMSSLDKDTCWYYKDKGHWKNNCPVLKQKVVSKKKKDKPSHRLIPFIKVNRYSGLPTIALKKKNKEIYFHSIAISEYSISCCYQDYILYYKLDYFIFFNHFFL